MNQWWIDCLFGILGLDHWKDIFRSFVIFGLLPLLISQRKFCPTSFSFPFPPLLATNVVSVVITSVPVVERL